MFVRMVGESNPSVSLTTQKSHLVAFPLTAQSSTSKAFTEGYICLQLLSQGPAIKFLQKVNSHKQALDHEPRGFQVTYKIFRFEQFE